MAESNWEQKKKHALTSLNILLDIWQARRPLTEIISTGPECNNAVLALGLETDLPLPYDEEKMSGTSLAAIFGAKDRSGGPDDEASNNIKAWIQLTEKAEYEPTKEEVKTLVLTKTFPSAETAWPVEEDRDLISQAAVSEEIPSERRSPPVSLTRLVECWGGDMTRKKLRKAIDLGTVRAVKITRQTYVFDTDKFPAHVIEKLRKE